MAILDELLQKLKRSTLDKTSLDERAVKFLQPKVNTVRQAPRNVYRGAMASPMSPPNVLNKISQELDPDRYESWYGNFLRSNSKKSNALVAIDQFARNERDVFDDINKLSAKTDTIKSKPQRILSNLGVGTLRAPALTSTGIKDIIYGGKDIGESMYVAGGALKKGGLSPAERSVGIDSLLKGSGKAGLGGLEVAGGLFRMSPFGLGTTVAENIIFETAKNMKEGKPASELDMRGYAKDYFISDALGIREDHPYASTAIDIVGSLIVGKGEDKLGDNASTLARAVRNGELKRAFADSANAKTATEFATLFKNSLNTVLADQRGGINLGAEIGSAKREDTFYDNALRNNKVDPAQTSQIPQVQGDANTFLRSPETGKVGTMIKRTNGEFVDAGDMVARERFNIPSLTKLSGGGSDRDVYDMGTDVLKVTKTSRGLDQNRMADYFASEQGLIPEVKEVGKNYVVFEKVDKPDANVRKMVKELNEIGTPYKWIGNRKEIDYEKLQKLYDTMERYEYPGSGLSDYGADILWGDILAIRNWGLKDGKPILLDEGSLNGTFVTTHDQKRGAGMKNLDDPLFRDIYNESKRFKKQFGDSDKNTMYGIVPPVAPEYDEENDKFGVRFAPEVTLASMGVAGGLREIRKGDLNSTVKSLRKLPDFKKYGDDAIELIAGEAKRLADMVEGVTKIPGEDGAMLRQSMNPPWYQDFFASTGRAPNNQELFEMAEQNLRTGSIDTFYPPEEIKAMSEFLDTDIKLPETKNLQDMLKLPGRADVPLLTAPEKVITSKDKLIDIFKKTGETKPFVNQLKPKNRPIRMGAYTAPEEVIPQAPKLVDGILEQPGRVVDDRLKRIEEVLYGSATPARSELGGTKEGAGIISNILRSGVTKVSGITEKALVSENPYVRNTATLLQDLVGNLGKSQEQITRASQYAGGVDYSTKIGYDTGSYVADLVGRDLKSLERIHAVLDPELATEKIDYESLTPKEKEATDFLRYVSDFINETNYKNEFITKEKYAENTGGKYIARAYEEYDFPPEFADFMKQRDQKLDLSPFKQRGDVTDWKKENAIRNPAYLVQKRLQQTLFNDNFRKMSNWLGTTDMVSDSPRPGFVQLSDHKAYGDLSGKYLRKDALEDMRGFFLTNQTAQKFYDLLNSWDRIPLRRLRKKMMTVFNPAVRLGNQVGDYMFAMANGINPATTAQNNSWAIKAIKDNDPLYRRAIQDGMMGTDLTRADIQRFATELKGETKDPNVLRKLDKILSDSYGRVDDVAKLSALKTHLDRGYTYDEAFRRVYNGFQNYNAVGFLYDVGAKLPIFGNPFVRFKSDILRIMKNAVVDHPIRSAGTLFAWKLFTDAMSIISEETPEDRETREGRLGAPRVPFTDISLAVQTPWGEVNASRLIGLYSLNSMGESGATGDALDYLPFEKPELKNVGTDPLIGGALSVAVDTDFRGKSISDPDANKYTGSLLTDEEKNANRIKFLKRAYSLPTMNDLSDVKSAVQGEPNFYGQKRTPLQAILRTAGLKIEQYGNDEAQLARDKEAMYASSGIEAEQRKISQVRNMLGRGEITEDEATRRIEGIQGNINKLQSKMTGTGTDVSGAGSSTQSLTEGRIKSLNNIFGVDRVSSLPEGSNYERAQKKAKQFEVVDKVLDADFLSASEQEEYLSNMTGLKQEEIGYYRVAKGGTDERYGYVLDELNTADDKMKALATMRYTIDDKKILTNNLIDRLEDEGYLSDAEAKLLKKLEYNQQTGKIQTSSSGGSSASSKLAKEIAKLNREDSEDLKKIFESFAQKSGKRTRAKDLVGITSRLPSTTESSSTRIEDVLSSKRTIKPTAKIG